MAENNMMDKIVNLAKRRGFIFPGSEIYGGISGVYDFGPYGVELKNNIKRLWWKTFVQDREDVVGIDSAILMNRSVWQASGHEQGFTDELVECKKCHQRFKADDIPEEKCPAGGEHEFTEPRLFNAMFETYIGVVKDENAKTYLRPETAQGMFVNFKQVLETSRKKIPFGIAQFGKSFRNEINTKDFIYRVREFEIGEIEYFVKPGEDEKAFDYWLDIWKKFVIGLGIKEKNLVPYEHPKESLAFYSKRTIDFNYKYPFGTKELVGVANRTDYDLKVHMQKSGKDLSYFDPDTNEKYVPYVIEPTCSLERLVLAILLDAYEETKPRTTTTEATTEKEVVLHLDPKIAPVKVAILPLSKKLSKEARKIYDGLRTNWNVEYDEAGSIGRRYRRQDEIGTPFCITVDFDSLEDKSVTVRDRDTMKQERVEIKTLTGFLSSKLKI